jgi:thioesterase domain-containing protein
LLGVEEITGRRLALSTFLVEPTLPGLCRAVTAAEEEARTPILALHRAGARPPIFCLYEATGDVGAYFELAAELGPDQPVFGIRSSALHHLERVPDSMETAARQVRDLLAEFHPVGPFALVGYSWAGILAFEVARQYAQEAGFNPFCGLLGSRPPPRQLSRFQRLLHAVRWLPDWAWRLARDRGRRWQRIRRAILSAQFFRHVAAGEKLTFPVWATGQTLAFEQIKLSHRYQPKLTHPVPVHLFRERGDFRNEPHPAHFNVADYLEDGGWRQWTGCAPTIHWLDGDHLTVLKRPQVTRTAQALRAALETHFASASPAAYPPRKKPAS